MFIRVMNPIKTIHAIAPIRINDIGGWTDTWFAQQGKVFNIAVFPLVEVRIQVLENKERVDQRVLVRLENYGEALWINPENPAFDQHPLIQGAINSMPIPKDVMLHISLFSHVPAGSSTGTSASVCVTLLSALSQLSHQNLPAHDIAYMAHRVETEKLGLQSGIQDQMAAAHGGICFIDMFKYPEATVTKLDVEETLLEELSQRISLIYLGQSHSSSAMHEEVITFLEEKGAQFTIIQALRALAEQAKNHMLEGNLEALGEVMIHNNECQRSLHSGLISEEADSVIAIAKKYEAAGWKVNGAGGKGGSLTILGNQDEKQREGMLEELNSLGKGIRSIPISLARFGVTVQVEDP
ncbi:MAG: GHMP kinase [Candidatus Aminicenantes bacterium]|nr:MAG: GHMP kinase [Candidatus Aminicenantes bacterium]